MKYDVFISYRQKSGIHQADALESKLKFKLNGCRVFLDRTGIKSGNWKKELDENIRESCNFVVIISKDCFPYTKKGKDYFLDEIDQALRLGKNVIPVYYDDMSYEDIKEYLSGIEDFHNQQHIIFNNNNTDGSVDQIIKFLKTEKEILNKRYKSLSKERTTVRQELMLLEEDKTDSKCPVCATSYTAEMIYCHNCGYKFFDDLEKAVANSNEKLQERGRLKIHKELWRNCQSDNKQNNTELNQELSALKTRLQVSETKREELEKQKKGLEVELERVKSPIVSDLPQQDLIIPVNGLSIVMKPVEGGTFWMGAQNTDPNGQNYDDKAYEGESPVHIVIVDSFYMGETMVTQALWEVVMGSEPTQRGEWDNRFGKGVDYPAYRVSYNDIVNGFLPKLNQMTSMNFRLPTEAEWEYAARGRKKSNGYKYAGSNIIKEVAWNYDNSGGRAHPVKSKESNELGLYDMSGNVWEWCSDAWYDYKSGEEVNPEHDGSLGSDRVMRGGSWRSIARRCRVSIRYGLAPDLRRNNIGFRFVLPQ